jgi:diaminopimelate epimerase
LELPFTKYQGTGNDFIMVDQRFVSYIDPQNTALIQHLCHRRFGIGADGLILLEKSIKTDFKMIYFNADGRESTMCGNGGRCIVHFAHALGVFKDSCIFEAIDGVHHAFLKEGWVHLQMNDVEEVASGNGVYVLDTGSPHYVRVQEEKEHLDIVDFGKSIRYNAIYKEEGINVNLVWRNEEGISVRTYERGVEDETLSCGTGAVASVIAANLHFKTDSPVKVRVQGGELEVSYKIEGSKFTNIFLCGPAKKVFSGKIMID